jgi:hypothetical protein
MIMSAQGKRSPLRNIYKTFPCIETCWKNDTEHTYKLRDTHLQQYPIFKTFDYEYFKSHQLPTDNIPYRHKSNQSVQGSKIGRAIDNLIFEIKQDYRYYTDFKVLKARDFNNGTKSGNIILKYKHAPFIVKVFMENPRSFVKPFSKGWQPGFFYIMNGGVNRYLAGFSRIKNLEYIKKHVAQHDEWNKLISTPRKWFYMPTNTPWLCVKGSNIGPEGADYIELPSTYTIVADEIHKERELQITSKKDREYALSLSSFLGNRVDPHIDNFVVEKETGGITLIDTEHFPLMVGLSKPITYHSYPSWYSQLCVKFLRDSFARTKRYVNYLQNNPQKPILPV